MGNFWWAAKTKEGENVRKVVFNLNQTLYVVYYLGKRYNL